jgi:hypothetical protein
MMNDDQNLIIPTDSDLIHHNLGTHDDLRETGNLFEDLRKNQLSGLDDEEEDIAIVNSNHSDN